MKTRFYQLLAIAFLVFIAACAKEEVQPQLGHEEATGQYLKLLAPEDCCGTNSSFTINSVQTTQSTLKEVCCTYGLTYTNTGRCPHDIYPGAVCTAVVGAVSTYQFEVEVCGPADGSGSGVLVTSTIAGQSYECASIVLDACGELECDLTYEQGFATGCNYGEAAGLNGCCTSACSRAYRNTERDYSDTCPDYWAGWMAGFEACNCQGGGTGGGDGPLCGGEPQPDPSCVCLHNSWVCE